MCLNVTRATPDYELQIIEFRQKTRSQPLEVHPLALSLPISVQEELIKDDFIYVPPQNETQQTSNNDYVIEELIKDDYVYEVSDKDPAKEQQQQSKEPLVAQQSEQEAPVNVRPLEQQQQPYEELTTQQSKQEAPVDVAAQPRERKDEMPSFNLGISPPASQPSHPSQPSVSQLEILEEAVVDAGVTAALKFAKVTILEPTLPAAEVYKTPEKKTKITNELIEKCYHWMTHVKQTKNGGNEYDAIFVLKHENFMLGTHGESYIDKRTNKAYQFNIEQYAHHRQFLDKRKLALHLFYDCGIYIMKWLETNDPQKIKSRKRYKYRAWTQEEIDNFRYQYGLHILLHEMNKIRDQVIWESKAIRLPKPSATLSSPYYKFTYGDLKSK
ncbi:hypothetical protein AHAS_Ahas19G0139900 [Arachis hypogaea]